MPTAPPLAPAASAPPRPPGSSAAAYEAARRICARHARSFYFASFFLPRAKRRHAYAVYAFCRLVDDSVDEAGDRGAALARLELLRRLLERAYAGDSMPRRATDGAEASAVLPAFARTVRERAIPRRHFEALLEGCRMDLAVSRYDTWAGLERYCYHVAGVVGLIMCRVLGLRDAAAEPRAVAMGNAMQLTNILRDVKEDFARGRVYLPREDLERFGVTEADLAAGRCDGRWRALMRFEIERARGLYREGCLGLSSLPRDGARLTAAAMASIYAGILDAIEAADFDVFTARRHLSFTQKLRRLPEALALNGGA